MSQIQVNEVLKIHIDPPSGNAKLSELKVLADMVQRTLDAVARNLAKDPKAKVDADVSGATIGSLHLMIQPAIADSFAVNPDEICRTLIEDINHVEHQHYRPDMTPALLQQYKALVNMFRNSHIQVQLSHGMDDVTIDDDFRSMFQVATKERIANKVDIIGKIEALNIHSFPYQMKLYPTPPETDYILCRFENELLDKITDVIKHKSLVRVTGTGYYAPVGIYPLRIELTSAPAPLVFDMDQLRSYARNVNLVPAGMSASEFLTANRKAANLEED
jgi:hypothetical protein